MKLAIAILALAIAIPAIAGDTAWYNADLQRLQWQRPGKVTVGGTDYGPNPHPDLVVAAGWQSLALDCAWTDTVTDWEESPPVRCMTAQELADREAARAAAAAAAEAAASLPTVFETGIAVLDADGHHMEFVPVADGEPPLAIQISDSPLDKATRDAKVAAKLAELAAAKAERKALKDRELDDLKAAIASAKNHKELGAAVVKWIEATEPATVEDSK
jgi:hypothetical protein